MCVFCLCVCLYVRVYIGVCMYVFMYLGMCVCVCVCVCACVHKMLQCLPIKAKGFQRITENLVLHSNNNVFTEQISTKLSYYTFSLSVA